ncbi:MAG: aminotransferase class I/II-fold pyridoxal phosphate-dependent enzyme [Phycisphaerales bacterium]|nr:aminotransferase class I/II-fold pyridoxal phosphate-dependent enzyme [Phycisphaerales bacterium]
MNSLVCDRARSIDASGIRRVFDLAAKMHNPINLSIGQPDFPVPDELKRAAVEAILSDRNGYSVTQGVHELRTAIERHLRSDVGWEVGSDMGVIVTSGTSGALLLAAMSVVGAGDEVIVPDPWFVAYPPLVQMCGGTVVACDTYPDFRLTAARVEPLLRPRTKMVIACSPSNPCGTVMTQSELSELAELCASRGVLLLSDEIYNGFVYAGSREDGRAPSPARTHRDLLLVRGFGKNYGCTGWRLGFAAGPRQLIEQMAKFQQYSFVCAPTPLQSAVAGVFDLDLSSLVTKFEGRRRMVMDRMSKVTKCVEPQGAFYAFVEVPTHLGQTATQFVERAIAERVLVIPGSVFSSRDTHFRLSFAAPDAKLEEGLDILFRLMQK